VVENCQPFCSLQGFTEKYRPVTRHEHDLGMMGLKRYVGWTWI
jgi:hypothetical protein